MVPGRSKGSVKFPAYGRALFNRRLLGERVRVVALLVGDDWRRPERLPAGIPFVAVKNGAWHEPFAPRFDWRPVVACSVLAFDRRRQGERAMCGEWDSWLWLLAEVQREARDVLLFTPDLDFVDPPTGFAVERYLDIYAWCSRLVVDGEFHYPPWWPYGDSGPRA